MTIKKILKDLKKINKKKEIIRGWVVSNRGNKNIKFITVSDGSTFSNIQIVAKKEIMELDFIDKIRMGASIIVEGTLIYTPGKEQNCEMIADKITLLNNTDEDYPLQKQNMSKEVLREIPHIRHRTNIFKAVMRVRSTLAQEIHLHFMNEGYLLAASPIITSNDGEGAGETFNVNDESKRQFFGKKATLGVTGQLHAEAYANGFGKVYTFAPTFRAEKSHTQRHAAEFWMVEPEVAFADLNEIIYIVNKMLKDVIRNTLYKLPEEFKYLEENGSPDIQKKLNAMLKSELKILDYKDAITELQKVANRFENKDIKFGIDLATEHEKYLAEVLVKGPVFVINYPKDIKAFYMYQNPDKKTVAAFDLLVPNIGELVGGSQRECDYNKLIQRIKELNMPQEDLQWYLDLRKFGQGISSGFGLGFERLVMYVTGIQNIRDSIPFPRTPGKLLM